MRIDIGQNTRWGIDLKMLLATLLAFFIFIVVKSEAANPREKPHVIFLLADDMGYGELGCYGQSEISTPYIDGLAKSGMLFTDFYAGTSVCSPSRASLQTGKHLGHARIRGNRGILETGRWVRTPLGFDERTLGEMLRMSDYETAFIGKWHLDLANDPSTWAFARGYDFAVQPQWGEGFDEAVHYFGNREDSRYYRWEENDCIDSFRTDIALGYLEERDWERPLFLLMSYRTPHAQERKIRDKEMYADRGWPERERVHAARITMLDEQVGRLLAKLDELGELENALVIFTSDNGPHHEGRHDHEFFDSNGPLRGVKRDLYEGGIRVPMIAAWPGKIDPGSSSTHVASFGDVFATLQEVAREETEGVADGISFLPTLLGENQAKHEHMYWGLQLDGSWNKMHDGGFRQAIRRGHWKAVRYGVANPVELYDLSRDLGETIDLAKSHPAVATELSQLMYQGYEDVPRFPWGGVPKSGDEN